MDAENITHAFKLATTVNDFAMYINTGEQIDAISDFSKDFEKVPHQKLFHKLSFMATT